MSTSLPFGEFEDSLANMYGDFGIGARSGFIEDRDVLRNTFRFCLLEFGGPPFHRSGTTFDCGCNPTLRKSLLPERLDLDAFGLAGGRT